MIINLGEEENFYSLLAGALILTLLSLADASAQNLCDVDLEFAFVFDVPGDGPKRRSIQSSSPVTTGPPLTSPLTGWYSTGHPCSPL